MLVKFIFKFVINSILIGILYLSHQNVTVVLKNVVNSEGVSGQLKTSAMFSKMRFRSCFKIEKIFTLEKYNTIIRFIRTTN